MSQALCVERASHAQNTELRQMALVSPSIFTDPSTNDIANQNF